jgi:hypothetical protein
VILQRAAGNILYCAVSPPILELTPAMILFHANRNEVVAAMIVGFSKYRYQRAINRKLKSVRWV